MIDRLSHATIYVLDQDSAKAFYTEKLGFEVRADQRLGNFRWLTVGPKNQDDLELVLMPIAGSPMTGEAKDSLRELVKAGKLGVGVFATKDCKKPTSSSKPKAWNSPANQPSGRTASKRCSKTTRATPSA